MSLAATLKLARPGFGPALKRQSSTGTDPRCDSTTVRYRIAKQGTE
jgi:hypothetical protein